jgi:four helix bundle protein
MTKEELKKRTKTFALRILKLARALPRTDDGRAIGKQIIRSGTSVGANYRAVCRARSTSEFIAKLGVVIEEADETVFWLEIIIESGLIKKELAGSLLNEANELTAIFVSTVKTIKEKNCKS